MFKVEFDITGINNVILGQIKYQLNFYFKEIEKFDIQSNKLIIESKIEISKEELESEFHRLKEMYRKVNKINKQPHIFFDSRNSEVINVTGEFNSLLELFMKLTKKLERSETKENRTFKQNIGLNIYSGIGVTLKDEIDKLFEEFFIKKYNAVNIKVPSIISTEVLERSKYFETGCQHLSFVSQLNNKPNEFRAAMQVLQSAEGDKFKNVSRYFTENEYALTPAVCLHCYPLIEQHYQNKELETFTLSGSVFRNESGNLNNNERLYEFQMREAVFLRKSEEVAEIQKELIEFFVLLGHILGLDFKLETANDMFFNENADKFLLTQIISDNKVELLCFSKKLDKYISVGSINKHHNHFTKAFNITDHNEHFLSTMCIAIGLDRLMLILEEMLEHKDLYFESIQKRLVDISEAEVVGTN